MPHVIPFESISKLVRRTVQFAEEIMLLLVTLAMVEDPLEEIVVGAIRCLEALALHLRVTVKNVKLVQDLLLHLVYKPAGQCCSE